MLAQFQSLYPNGSIISELIQIFQGKYIVRVSVQIEGVTRATGMAAAETIEVAEDQARNRALTVLGMTNTARETAVLPSKTVSPVQVNPIPNPPASIHESVHPPAEAVSGQWANSGAQEPTIPSFTARETHPQIEAYQQPVNPNLAATTSQTEQPTTLGENLGMFTVPEPENRPLPEITASNVTPFTPRSYNSLEDMGVQPTTTSKRKKKSEPVNLSDVIAKTDVHIERLGWTPEQGKDYLIKTYGKRGRSLLSEEELLDFLRYLESQPDPIAGF
jgi:hypothetical protein